MLNKFVSLYVPSTNKGKTITRRVHNAYVREIAEQFSTHFGGCTCTQGVGYWKSESSGLVAERVTIVKSYYSIESDIALSLAQTLANSIKTRLGQEAVSLETESGIDFV